MKKKPTTDTKQTTPKKKKPSFVKYLVVLWTLYILGVASVFCLFLGVASGMFGPLPTFIDLESPKSSLASEVYSSDGVLLGKFFIVDRSNAEYDEIPEHVVHALIATEDVRFHDHSGIDFWGLGRVLFKTVLGRDKSSGGGSTITQQLAKNLFHERPGSTLDRVKQKLKEWVIAVKLEKSYTKEEIVNMYLNIVPFSHNAHGIKAASKVYFNCPPDSLKIQEGAVLVGMLKGSTKYNPKRNPKNSITRRNVVLSQMAKYGRLEEVKKDSLMQIPLELNFNRMTHDEGLATYFREYVKSLVKEWSKDNLKVDGQNYDIYRDGLKIYTTINSNVQKYAEEAVTEHMAKLQKQFYKHWNKKTPWKALGKARLKKDNIWYGQNKLVYQAIKNSERYRKLKQANQSPEDIKKAFETPTDMEVFSWNGGIDTTLSPLDSIKYYKMMLHTGFMAMDPVTGHILAWVGGINHKHFKYDNIRKNAKRQVGSTFKPIIYAMAIENGRSPCQKIPNLPVTFEDYDNWTPKNAGGYLNGQMVSLETGLAHSINRITASLMKEIAPESVIKIAQKMGIESHMDPYPSICLGTPDISVYEMVGAYSTFANKGFMSKPMALMRIEDKKGNLLQTFTPLQKEVLNEQVAYAMISLLKGVTDRGTANRIRWKHKITAEVAGKTGTTNDNSDGWYIGMTPKVIAGAWVGGDEKAIRFRTTQLGCGANMALPIWANFMNKLYKDVSLSKIYTPDDRFERPIPMNIELDCSKYDTEPAVNPADSTVIDNRDTDADDYDYNDEFED